MARLLSIVASIVAFGACSSFAQVTSATVSELSTVAPLTTMETAPTSNEVTSTSTTTTTTVTTSTTTSSTTLPPPATTTAVMFNYTKANFYTSESYGYRLVNYIQDFLQETRGDYTLGSITAVCNTTADSTGNFTCVATFSNVTQAVKSVEGGNAGLIETVFYAYFGNAPTTTAPVPPTTRRAPHSDTASAMGILIGTMAGIVIFFAFMSIVYVIIARKLSGYMIEEESLMGRKGV